MDTEIYQRMSELEKNHWWFVARRKILMDIISQSSLAPGTDILEAGCGTGGNLEMLSSFGNVHAIEFNDDALRMAKEIRCGDVKKGWLPDRIPFGKKKFGFIAMLDVLEHIEDDAGALRSLGNRINPQGILLITVPAFPLLWSKHDEMHHHYRRYRRAELIDLVRSAGFTIEKCSYFNSWLFPAVFAARILFKNSQSDDMKATSPILNRFLTNLFSSERFYLRHFNFPAGVSLVLKARKM